MIKTFNTKELVSNIMIQKFTRDELKKIKAQTVTLFDFVNNANIKDDQKLQLIVLLGKPDKKQILKMVVACVKLSYRFFYQFEEHHPCANEIYKLILDYYDKPDDNKQMVISSVLSTVRSSIDLTTNNTYTMSYGVNDNRADTLYFCLQDILFLLFNAGCYIVNADRPSAVLYADSVFHHMSVYINKACHYEKSQERAESLHRYLHTFIEKN